MKLCSVVSSHSCVTDKDLNELEYENAMLFRVD